MSAATFEALDARIRDRQISWAQPLTLLFARTGLCILAQGLVTLIFARQGHPDPLRASTAWWPVTGTLVDLGCLALMLQFTRREGIRLLDLIGFEKSKLKSDLLKGLGIFVIGFPVVMMSGAMLSGLLVFGTIQPPMPAEVMAKALPLWAALYARLLWWPVWSVTEEMTYNGYALPRLRALFGGRTWPALAVVTFFWAIQHAFLPFLPDGKVFLYLFLQMIPLTLGCQLLYLRFRRLPPVIVAHWGMDLFSAIAMIGVN